MLDLYYARAHHPSKCIDENIECISCDDIMTHMTSVLCSDADAN